MRIVAAIMLLVLWICPVLPGWALGSVPDNADSAFATALEAYKLADYPRAHLFAEQAFKLAPTTKKFGTLYGWTLLKLGRFDEALAVHRQVLALDPYYIETIQFGAWLAFFRRDAETAQAGFQQELDWVDGHRQKDAFKRGRYKRADYTFIGGIAADAHYGLGQLALQREESREALRHLELAGASAAYLGRRDVLPMLADLQFRLGDVESAAATLQKAADEFGAETVAPTLAKYYLLSSEPGRAGELVAPLAERLPANAYYPMILALSLAADEQSAEADAALAKSLALSPEILPAAEVLDLVAGRHPAVRDWLASAGERFYGRANFAAARLLLYRAAVAGDCAAKLKMGWSNYYLGYPVFALDWFKGATLAHCSPPEEALLGQGMAELALGHDKSADQVFTKAVSIKPDYDRVRFARAAVSYFRKDYAGTIRTHRAYRAVLPASEPFWGWGAEAIDRLGWAYYFSGQFREAEDTFSALDHYVSGRDFAAPKVGLGWSLLRRGDTARARRWFEQALTLDPGSVLAMQGLAELNK